MAGVVLDMRSAEEVRRNLVSFEAGVPAQVWADLPSEDLLDERARQPT